VGCSAERQINAVVELSRSLPVIGVPRCHSVGAVQLWFEGDLQVDAQRFQRVAHRVDHR
jgi:hypothetical protein